MSTSTETLHIVYTDPSSADAGQNTVEAPMDGTPLALTALGGTRLVVQHPAGQTLRLAEPALAVDTTSASLSISLPPGDGALDIVLVAEPSATAMEVKVTTKKEYSKPDPPRSASFGRPPQS